MGIDRRSPNIKTPNIDKKWAELILNEAYARLSLEAPKEKN